jgi:hypothetical protein
MSLSFSRFAGCRGSASSERWPRARGPYSERPLEPGHHAVVGQHLGDGVGDVVGALERDAGRLQPRRQRLVVPAAPERGGVHRLHAIAHLGRDVHGRAERRAGVARGRLHPDALERRLPPQPRVRHAVQRDAAGEHQVAVARALVQPPGEVEQDLLEAALHGARQRGVRGSELRLGCERRREAREIELGGHAEPALAVGLHQLPEGVEELGLPVGGHGHDLVLVGRAAEAQVRGQLLVEQAERMGQVLRGEHVELAAGEADRPGATPRSPRPSSTSTEQGSKPDAKVAEAAWATWWGTQRTRSGSRPGRLVLRNSGARRA